MHNRHFGDRKIRIPRDMSLFCYSYVKLGDTNCTAITQQCEPSNLSSVFNEQDNVQIKLPRLNHLDETRDGSRSSDGRLDNPERKLRFVVEA